MAHPRYVFDDHQMAEREPLGASASPYHPRNQYYPPSRSQQQYQDSFRPPSFGPRPGAHSDSAFEQLRMQRRNSRGQSSERSNGHGNFRPYVPAGAASNSYYEPQDIVSPISPPQPPPHRAEGRLWGNDQVSYSESQRPRALSNITPGADDFSNAAAGGMTGIALTVADQTARESGLNALHGPAYPREYDQSRQFQSQQTPGPNAREASNYPQAQMSYASSYTQNSGPPSLQNSSQALDAAQYAPGAGTPGQATPSRSPPQGPGTTGAGIYTDDPFLSYGRPQPPGLGVVDPLAALDDDGDDGLNYHRKSKRNSILSLGNGSNKSAAAVAGTAAAGGVIGGLASGNGSGNVSGYTPVKNNVQMTDTIQAASPYDPGFVAERPGWNYTGKSSSKGKKWRLVAILALGLLVAAGIALGIVFGVVLKHGGEDKKQGESQSAADDDTQKNGDLDINSSEIKALMNNPDLHKVFPGMDYTPLNTQYPDCIHNPPSQNNITRDIAVLSQLTNTVRLYGTDCNQTEMVIHALKQLKLENTIKIWMGVWQDGNTTTNDRQLSQMWTILDTYGEKWFKGLIVANEILFREEMTLTGLSTLLSDVRTNLTSRGMKLPVATSDLGDNWDESLAKVSDYIMANIHPFFGGVPVKKAAAWTTNFWQDQVGAFMKSDKSKNIISETGWPSQGGTDCGLDTKTTNCPDRAVAGITELNQFMSDFVCSALANGTNYFWFEAFDEPWKVQFNTKDQQWEDHWGLMDVDRNLKKGVKIPDCGGKTID
ncbi:glycoside hydrolase superfamily [Neurospora tetraspora]|uniref:glucan endo-1,3-beta-D-glucosidase n=1 Tax=Neurospora tetraspora TaxID=94610 RepID=A0AAE0MWS2_9PEZI|nr:glycoside hydrolase superfamily [Neurospora tetraspora]